MVHVRMTAVAAALVAVTALGLAGCDSGTGDSGTATQAGGPVNLQGAQVEKASADPEPGGKPVTRAQLGVKWPLTIESGTLHCKGSKAAPAVTLYADGITYALNLNAQGDGFAQPGPIWADDKDNAGAKLAMGPLVEEGMKLCQ